MHIAIVGNGITGITAARTARKLDAHCRISVISSETKFFFSRTALMYVYMGHLKFEHTKPYEDSFWARNKIDIIEDHVLAVDYDAKTIRLRSGSEIKWDKLLLATGSVPNELGIKGGYAKGVQCMYSYQDLMKLEENTHRPNCGEDKQKVRKAVIAGGGLIGMELAEMLLSRNISVTILVREKWYWGNVLPENEGRLIAEHMKAHHVELKLETELREINSDETGRVVSIVTSSGEEIKCQFVGLTAGVSPNIEFLRNGKLQTGRGILVNNKMETNIANVYSAGDCAELTGTVNGRKSIEQVWYTGRMMGEVAGVNLTGGNAEYRPGPWFNSAKFFDIEYQVYGTIGSTQNEEIISFYWQNDIGNKAIRINYRKDGTMEGVNALGIRLRHEVLHKWLLGKRTAQHFIDNWKKVNFDPEFEKSLIREISIAFRDKFATVARFESVSDNNAS